MPMGQEIWLGLKDDEARVAFNDIFSLGIPNVWAFTKFIDPNVYDEEAEFKPFNDKLDAAYPEALKALGLAIKGLSTNDYIVADTPLGLREMSGWALGLHYDPDEVGGPPVLGVGLSGRYYPALLDWRSKHGTLEEHGDLRQIIAEADKVIPIIHRELPFTKDWKLLLVDIFY